MRNFLLIVFMTSLSLILLSPTATVSAHNIGMLRVANFQLPREVLPGASFPVSLDVEYAIQGLPNTATIRGAVYAGEINSSGPLWQSEPTSVSNGGDQVWNFTLTAPTLQGPYVLAAYALYDENGTWTYFNNSVNGPGVSQATLKIGKVANLDVNVGAVGVDVTVDGSTIQSSNTGDAVFTVALTSSPTISIPQFIDFPNSTRLAFLQWSDGATQIQRNVLIDGDTSLYAYYKTQYLLTINAGSASQQWYDEDVNVTINAATFTSVPWPLNELGVTKTFQYWSGDVQSSSPQINVTMNSPKTITADITTDYRPLIGPVVFAVGLAVAVVSLIMLLRRRGTPAMLGTAEETQGIQPQPEIHEEETAEQSAPPSFWTCPNCGRETEPEWGHCIKCGTKLK